ncbi:MAG: CAP domain-containing protein [Planctomycetota bacterium]
MDERRLTAWLIMQGYLAPDQVKTALEEQLRLKRGGTDVDIIEVARRQRLVTDEQVIEILTKTGYQPPRQAAPAAKAEPAPKADKRPAPPPSEEESLDSLDSVSGVGAVSEDEDLSTPSERVPAIDAAEAAKELPAGGVRKRGMSSASYAAAKRRGDGAIVNVLVGGLIAGGALIILMMVGGGSSSSGTHTSEATPTPTQTNRADELLDRLREGVKALESQNLPGESRKRDIAKLEALVEELRREKLLVSQGRIVEKLAMQLARLSGKEGPKPPPELDRTQEAEAAWAALADSFQKILWLSLQQPRNELLRGAELVRGVNLRKRVSDELQAVSEKGADAIASLVSAPDLHPILGVGGYSSILRECERFPEDLRETERWKRWSGILARFKQLQRVAREFEEALRLADEAAQRGDIKRAREAFSVSRYASDAWFKATLDYLSRPEVIAAFEARAKEVAGGGPIVRRRVVPRPGGEGSQTDWGTNWRERFLNLERAWKKAQKAPDERKSIVAQLVELLKETESLAKASFPTCREVVFFYDEHLKLFKDEPTDLGPPLKRHHELYFQGALARATGPATLRDLDRWCADHGYEAWRGQLRPLLRLVGGAGVAKADRGREVKRTGRAQARQAVEAFSDKRLGIVVKGFEGLLDWMDKRGYAPKEVKEELDAMLARGIERAGDPVAGQRLRDRLSRLEHKPKGDGSGEAKAYQKQLANVIKEAVDRSLKAVEKCVASGEPGLAFDLFSYVLQLDPENDRAHKGLGHIKVGDKWLRRFLATRLQAGWSWDPKLAWKKVGSDARYAKGEVYDLGTNQWSELAAANKVHADAGNPWIIDTEHFKLRSTADLDVSAQVAERLEAFYLQLFRQYDLFFMDKGGAKLIFGMSAMQSKPLVVNFYRTQEQFKQHSNPPTEWAAGFYSGGKHASFFYATGGWTVLQHEIVHQILGETAGGGGGDAWLAEGAAVYLEDAFFREGVLTLGEKQHHQRIVAYESAERSGGKEHKLLDMLKFRTSQDWDSGDIAKNYRGAGAVVYFLCNFDGGRYRGDFVEYLRAAYNGQRPKLGDFFGIPENVLDLLMRRFYDPNAKLELPGGGKAASAEDLAAAQDALSKVSKKKVVDVDQLAAAYELLRNALGGSEGKEADKARREAVRTLAALRKRLAGNLEKAIKGAVAPKEMVARLGKLKELQGAALRAINDKGAYPDADHGKVGQPFVDQQVKALTEYWSQVPPIFDEPELKAALDVLELSEPWLGELGADAKARGKGKKELVEELQEKCGCRGFDFTPELKKAKDYNERVYAFNEAQTQIPPESREQVKVLNDYRLMLGLHALALDDRLYQCAAKHTAWMEQAGNMTHDEPSPARRTPMLRAKLEGYPDGVGENVAFGYPTATSVHWGWYNSSGHHRNMVYEKFWVIGVAKSGTYWTQNFGMGKPTSLQ